MDEMTTAQNINQDEAFDDAFEDEEIFDMAMANKAAAEMFEQQQLEEMSRFREIEGFASIFPDNWVLTPPTDSKKVNVIISNQLAKKAIR